MNKLFKLSSVFLCIIFASCFVSGCGISDNGSAEIGYGNVLEAKNVILLIGDGMGTNQIKAGSLTIQGELFIEKLPNRCFVETRSADSETTDSAASGTALATGVRTNNGYVGVTPDGTELETIVDIASRQGKKTGIITTENLNGATPMAFSGHSESRADYTKLLKSAAESSNVNLFISTGNVNSVFTDAGYTVMESVDAISEMKEDKIIGAFPISATEKEMSDYSFDRIVYESLEYLSQDQDGFFLMAEGAHIDHGAHENNIMYMLRELWAFDLGVKAAVEWAAKRTDTVVLVTADHETGGLVLANNINSDNFFEIGDQGDFVNFRWTTTWHTAADVYLYLYGMKMDYSEKSSFNDKNRVKNTDIFNIIKDFITN